MVMVSWGSQGLVWALVDLERSWGRKPREGSLYPQLLSSEIFCSTDPWVSQARTFPRSRWLLNNPSWAATCWRLHWSLQWLSRSSPLSIGNQCLDWGRWSWWKHRSKVRYICRWTSPYCSFEAYWEAWNWWKKLVLQTTERWLLKPVYQGSQWERRQWKRRSSFARKRWRCTGG